MQLIFGHDRVLADWARKHIPHMRRDFGPCRAIGVAAGSEEQSAFYAAVVYHNYVENAEGWHIIEVSIASISARWAQKGIIRALLSVPFEQYGVGKMYSIMAQENTRAIKFNKGIGFTQEAVLRHHFGRGRHGVVTSMLDKEYFRIYGDGKFSLNIKKPNIVKMPCTPFALPA